MNRIVPILIIATLLILPITYSEQGTVQIRVIKTKNVSYTEQLEPYISLINNDSQAQSILSMLNAKVIGLNVYNDSEAFLYTILLNNSKIYEITESTDFYNTDLIIKFPLSKISDIEENIVESNLDNIIKIVYKNVEIPILLKIRLSLYILFNPIIVSGGI